MSIKATIAPACRVSEPRIWLDERWRWLSRPGGGEGAALANVVCACMCQFCALVRVKFPSGGHAWRGVESD